MVQHGQQRRPFVGGFADPVIQRPVAGGLFAEGIKRVVQPCAFLLAWGFPRGQQVAVAGLIVRSKRCQHCLMMQHAGRELGVVPPIVHPTQRVGVGQMVVDRRIIAEQPAEDGHLRLRVIGGDGEGVPHRLLLLWVQRHAGRRQVLLQRRRRPVALPRQRCPQAGAQCGRQAGCLQPGARLGIQAADHVLPPQHRQPILTRTAGTGVVAGKPGIPDDVADLVLPVNAGRGLVGRDPRAAGEPRLMDGGRLVCPLPVRVKQHARQGAGANLHANIPQERPQRRLTDVGAVAEGEHQRPQRRAKGAVIAGRQRCGERRLRARDIPDLADKADHLRVNPQVLHDHVGRPVPYRVRGQHRRVDHAPFFTRDG